jgi:hypothetical protein
MFGTKMPLGVDRALAAPRERKPGWRGEGGLRAGGDGRFTGVTGGLVEESNEEFGLCSTCLDRLGRRRLARCGLTLEPYPVSEQAEPKQGEERECAENQVIYHLLSSSVVGAIGGILPVFQVRELSV